MTTPEIEGLEIVTVGAFNPQIFNPDWLLRQELIQKGEGERAQIDIIGPDISVFSLGWTRLQISREIASFSTNQVQYYEILRDLVSGIFKYLRYTPVYKFGINFHCHFGLESEDARDRILDKFAPRISWSDILPTPHAITLSVQGSRTDDYEGNINVSLEPSVSIRNGLYCRLNDHFELGTNTETEMQSDKMIRILNAGFDDAKNLFNRISSSVLK